MLKTAHRSQFFRLLRPRRAIRVGNLDAAILGSARVGCVICNRPGLAKALGAKPVPGDPMLREPRHDSLGARFRERLIVGIAAHIVRVPLDFYLLRGILLQQIQNLLQHRIAGRLQRGLVEVEEHAVDSNMAVGLQVAAHVFIRDARVRRADLVEFALVESGPKVAAVLSVVRGERNVLAVIQDRPAGFDEGIVIGRVKEAVGHANRAADQAMGNRPRSH